MAFQSSPDTLDIRLRTTRGSVRRVQLVHGDPFHWKRQNDTRSWAGLDSYTEMDLENRTRAFDYWFARIRVPSRRVKYAFLLEGRWLFGARLLLDAVRDPGQLANLDNLFNYPYLLEADRYQAPEWVESTVWYSIFPDRFHQSGTSGLDPSRPARNDRFFGGDLKGIEEKLDYIADELGCNGLYLNPVFESPSAHKYDVTDYFRIDPRFGDEASLRRLVKKAHAKGVRVMLDAVFNHVSYRHPFFQDVLEKGAQSPYYDAFHLHEDFDAEAVRRKFEAKERFRPPYAAFAFSPRMPKVNTEHPLMREYLLEVATYWIETADIDGWRLDVGNEVSHDFWREFRKRVKAAKPDAYILGENWDYAFPWLQGDQHDGTMQYDFLFAVHALLAPEKAPFRLDTEGFRDFVVDHCALYPRPVHVNLYNLLDSHDTQRIARVLDNQTEKLEIAYALLFALPGTPSIYYGGEIGLDGGKDPDNRRAMDWQGEQSDKRLFETLKPLIRIYREEADFRRAHLEWLQASDGVLAFRKGDLLFLYNVSQTPGTVQLGEALGQASDLLTGRSVNLKTRMRLPGFTFRIYRFKD